MHIHIPGASLGGSAVKKLLVNAGDLGLIPGSGRSPGEGNGNPLQYSCLENPLNRGARWAIVHGVANSRTRLKQLSTHSHPVLVTVATKTPGGSFGLVLRLIISRRDWGLG